MYLEGGVKYMMGLVHGSRQERLEQEGRQPRRQQHGSDVNRIFTSAHCALVTLVADETASMVD